MVISIVVSLNSETAGLPGNISNTLAPTIRLTINVSGRSVCGNVTPPLKLTDAIVTLSPSFNPCADVVVTLATPKLSGA